jgi:hypothetical protein
LGRKAKVQGGVGLVGRVPGGRWSRLGRKGRVKGEVGWQSAWEGKFFRKSSWVRGRVGRKER